MKNIIYINGASVVAAVAVPVADIFTAATARSQVSQGF